MDPEHLVLFTLRVTCDECSKVIGHVSDVSVQGQWSKDRITSANTVEHVKQALRDHVRLFHARRTTQEHATGGDAA